MTTPTSKAKRGDLVAVPTTRTWVMASGGHHSAELWRVFRVTSVRKDGLAQGFANVMTDSIAGRAPFASQSLIPAARFDVAAIVEAIKARGDDDFESVEELKALVAQHRKA